MDFIERQVHIALSGLAEEANIPMRTGNLREALKVRKVGPGRYEVYIDEEQAPYAENVEEIKPFWERVAMTLSYRLASALGGQGRREDIPDQR